MAGVVVLYPWWGLNDVVVAYADQLADGGFAVVVPDLYEGRLATTIEEADRFATSLEEDVADAFALAAVDVCGDAANSGTASAVGFSGGDVRGRGPRA